MSYDVIQGDCRDTMTFLADDSIDAIISDPPYGLSFMGKGWDHAVPGVEFWSEALRVAKPGAHLAAFGGTRTYHRLACAIEDAGWELRDCLMWLYGTGFPKSLDVSKAIDKTAGVEREVIGTKRTRLPGSSTTLAQDAWSQQARELKEIPVTAPATAAAAWAGWGTALKPAWEPIILARKPLVGTVAANVLEHGTGAINIADCRVGDSGGTKGTNYAKTGLLGIGGKADIVSIDAGRWPANVLLDEEAAAVLDEQAGVRISGSRAAGARKNGMGYHGAKGDGGPAIEGSSGGASRFFYVAKASRAEREAGCEMLPQSGDVRNHHPTVKPIELMRWLTRLLTPPNGTVLDPFTGSGSTGCAAVLEGFNFLGCELSPEYVEIAKARIAHHAAKVAG